MSSTCVILPRYHANLQGLPRLVLLFSNFGSEIGHVFKILDLLVASILCVDPSILFMGDVCTISDYLNVILVKKKKPLYYF
jgi:hypothetical protein